MLDIYWNKAALFPTLRRDCYYVWYEKGRSGPLFRAEEARGPDAGGVSDPILSGAVRILPSGTLQVQRQSLPNS